MNPETPTPNVVQPNQPGTAPNDAGSQPSVTPPNQDWQPSSPPPVSGPTGSSKTKRIILITVGAVLVLAIGFSIVKALTGKKDNSNSNTSIESELYHSRPGYDIKEYGSDIGDPLALNMDKAGEVHKSPKGPVVYACNILAVKDLNNLKTYVMARQDPKGVTRNFIDGVGQAAIAPELSSLPTSDEGNECNYSLQSGGLLSVTVYQEPFTSKATVMHQLDRNYTKTTSINGLDTYKEKERASTRNYMLLSGNDAIEVLFNGTKVSDDAQKTILEAAAKNFIAQQSTAQGPALATYETPTYKKRYARACDLISNADIKALTGSDASAYANEGLATGTGIAKVDDKLYNFIMTSCNRFNTGIGSGIGAGPFDQKLEMTITSFNEDAPAKQTMQKTGSNVKQKTTLTTGDEGFGYQDTAGQNTVLFRQGRFVVELVFDRTLQDKAGVGEVSAMNTKLAPFAQQTATKLKELQ